MHASFPSQNNPLIQKSESVFALTKAERQVLAKLPMEPALIEENQDIVRGRPPLPVLPDPERLYGHLQG